MNNYKLLRHRDKGAALTSAAALLVAVSLCLIGALKFKGTNADGETLPARVGGKLCEAAGYLKNGNQSIILKLRFDTTHMCCGYTHPMFPIFMGCEG